MENVFLHLKMHFKLHNLNWKIATISWIVEILQINRAGRILKTTPTQNQ